MGCTLCPRACGLNRTPDQPGFCGAREESGVFRLGQIQLHAWEEPYISGPAPGGAINLFFSGCSLRCCYCQNRVISHEGRGRLYTEEQILQELDSWVERGAHSIGFVTAETETLRLLPLLRRIRSQNWGLPVVWNTSSYQTVPSLRLLEGLVDVYLPDLKTYDAELAAALMGAPEYFAVAWQALQEMLRQQPQLEFHPETGVLQRGVALRHLVLPGFYRDSFQILEQLSTMPGAQFLPLALLAQYTPDFVPQSVLRNQKLKSLGRRVTTFEYQRVVQYAQELGFERLLGQERASATHQYTPKFWMEDPLER